MSGRVLDDTSGAPIEGALVVLERAVGEGPGGVEESDVRTITGADGRFRLARVPAGLVILHIEHLAYGVHRHPLQVEGDGVGEVQISLSPTAIVLEPILVQAEGSGGGGLGLLSSPSSRNVIGRDVIARGAATGVALGDFLGREVAGMYVRGDPQMGGSVCIEFRGARRGDGPCRPPQVYIDGIAVPSPMSIFASFSLDGLSSIRVVSPSEAGARFGPDSGWGVLLLETRRTGIVDGPEVPLLRRRPPPPEFVDWSFEGQPYPWKRVYTTAFLGNAAGLAAAAVIMNQCMDLETRRFYRGPDSCSPGLLLTAGIAASVLPALGGAFGARWAGSTPRSVGRFTRSILASTPAFVPGFALASLNAGSAELGPMEIVGLAAVVFLAPALNTIADRSYRRQR